MTPPISTLFARGDQLYRLAPKLAPKLEPNGRSPFVRQSSRQPDTPSLIMGHQPRPSVFSYWRPRLRLLLRTLYPSFVFRRAAIRPLSLISILFVLSFICTGVYLVVPVALLPEYTTSPMSTLIRLILFLWCIGCTLISYLLTALGSPGKVPDTWKAAHWHPQPSNADSMPVYPVAPTPVQAAGTSMLAADGRFRYCMHCNIFKPDRTHHCPSCEECVLQMDHHCPFTGNSCVGFMNRKFFILFLYYATISCTLVATMTPTAILKRLQFLKEPPTGSEIFTVIAQMMGYLFCALHALVLAPFSMFHTYLIVKNRTTIENQEPRSVLHADVLRRSDRAWLNNWKATFGPVPWLWFVPVTYRRQGDGMCWSRAEDVV